MSEFILQAVLPAVLFLMMFTMGISLTLDDFRRVFSRPLAFSLGTFNQIIVLPMVAFGLLMVFDLEPEFAIGVMILSACPGGVVSNVISYFGRADVALSISLTACISIISLFTMPLIAGFAVNYFEISNSIESFPYLRLALTLLLVTILPVFCGMLLRNRQERFAQAIQPTMDTITGVFFLAVVAAAIVSNWNAIVLYAPKLGTFLIFYCSLLLVWGLVSARALKLELRSTATIAFETSVQNVATAILIGGTVLKNEAFFIPAALYGVIMYLPAACLIFWMRRKFSD